jgi:MFS family permease
VANGVSQTVQNVIFPKEVLGLGVGPMSAMRTAMQVGQFTASRPVGCWSDRFGNRPVLVLAQACVTASLMFYLLASPRWPWLLAGAWLLFSAYVAHNICLPNLVLKLAPPAAVSGYVAASDALGSLCHALSTIAGGLLFDWLRGSTPSDSVEPYRSCLIVLGIGLAMRSLAVPLAAAIREPGAWTWREILRCSRESGSGAS